MLQDERLEDLLESMRGKFKALVAALGKGAEFGLGARAGTSAGINAAQLPSPSLAF